MAKNSDQSQILERLDRIEAKLDQGAEEFLTFDQGADFLGLSPSYCYKLTHTNRLPFYRPGGKKIYFKRSELQKWIEDHRIASVEEVKTRLDSVGEVGGRRH
jgi:excisionase family DNA binding protein